ncbi:MAG: TlpA family protein disulfide reductase [Gammaproteobacteria bacterium]|nr:TlpA family protein disulfide reductase [Gammaproteobacteria bacterium]
MPRLIRLTAVLVGSALAIMVLPTPTIAADLPTGIRAMDGRVAPDFSLKDVDGNTQRLSAYRGQWVFLHFWASWCGPCRLEMPKVDAISAELTKVGMVFLLVNTSEPEDVVFSFLGDAAPDLTSALDADGLVTETWDPRGLPATFLVDPDGKIRYQALGGRPWDEPGYRTFLKRLIK